MQLLACGTNTTAATMSADSDRNDQHIGITSPQLKACFFLALGEKEQWTKTVDCPFNNGMAGSISARGKMHRQTYCLRAALPNFKHDCSIGQIDVIGGALLQCRSCLCRELAALCRAQKRIPQRHTKRTSMHMRLKDAPNDINKQAETVEDDSTSA